MLEIVYSGLKLAQNILINLSTNWKAQGEKKKRTAS